jgi:UDP-N-acetylglucosamine acyltransferase
MAGSHAGHNAVVGDETILVNGAVLAGHVEVGRNVILSGHVGIHQFCWIGELVMVQGNAGLSMHVPPYMLAAMPLNRLVGLNVVGLRRAPYLCAEDRRQIKEAFRITYRSGRTPLQALEKMDSISDWGKAAGRFHEFIRKVLTAKAPYNRGLCPLRGR